MIDSVQFRNEEVFPGAPRSLKGLCFKITEECCVTPISRWCCVWISQTLRMKMCLYQQR